MKRKKNEETRAYLDGFGTAQAVLELDELTLDEIADALDPTQESRLGPWKRGYYAAIRSACGH
jgi:hypothetical protein